MFRKVFDYAQSLLRTHLNPKGLSWRHGWRMANVLAISLFLTCGAAAAASSPAGAASPTPAATAARNRVAAHYGKIPLSFEAEPGADGLPGSVSFARLRLRALPHSGQGGPEPGAAETGTLIRGAGSKPQAASVDTLRMSLIGANSGAAAVGVDPQPGVVSYFIGNDPKNWRSGIPTYGKVKYRAGLPRRGPGLLRESAPVGVRLCGRPRRRPQPHRLADRRRPRQRRRGGQSGAELRPNGPASFKKPVLYQMDGDTKTSVEGSFAVAGNQVRFRLGSYDHSRALIIDPVLSYASYLAGSGTDHIGLATGPGDIAVGTSQGLAVDSAGSAYVTGYTYSIDFPTKNPYQSAPPAKGWQAVPSPGLAFGLCNQIQSRMAVRWFIPPIWAATAMTTPTP